MVDCSYFFLLFNLFQVSLKCIFIFKAYINCRLFLKEFLSTTHFNIYRKSYNNKKSAEKQSCSSRSTPQSSRSIPEIEPADNFDFKSKCFYCAEEITQEFIAKERRKPEDKRIKVIKVCNANFKEGVIKAAAAHDDDWSTEVNTTFIDICFHFLFYGSDIFLYIYFIVISNVYYILCIFSYNFIPLMQKLNHLLLGFVQFNIITFLIFVFL